MTILLQACRVGAADGAAFVAPVLAALAFGVCGLAVRQCPLLQHLRDVELPILERIVQQSYAYIKLKSQDGPIDQILWKAEQ